MMALPSFWFVDSPCCRSKDRFLNHVTRHNSTTTRLIMGKAWQSKLDSLIIGSPLVVRCGSSGADRGVSIGMLHLCGSSGNIVMLHSCR